MGFLASVLNPERRRYSADSDYWYTPVGGVDTAAGVRVSTDKAMRSATVFACVRVLSESIGSVPCKLYRRLPGGGKVVADRHPMYRLVHDAPNEQMGAMTFFETVMAHMTTRGNSYCLKNPNRIGRVMSLELLSPMDVTVDIGPDGEPRYKVRIESGQERVFTRAQLLHIPALAWDGVRGLAPIEYARESIGLALAAEEFGSRYFSNGTNAGAVITMPEGIRMDDEQTKKFVEDFERAYQGLGKAHRSIMVPSGTTYTSIGIPPDQAQFLETRKFQKADIASIFRVPLHMIQEHEKSTSWGTGIYQMTLGFVTYTLRPWAVRIEQALNQQLLTEREREQGYFFEFLLDALLRGDLEAQSNYFREAIQNGILSRNEVREIINRNPVEGGDEYLIPLNMTVAGDEPQPDEEPVPEEEPQRSGCECGHEHRMPESVAEVRQSARPGIERSYIRVIRDAMDRVIRRERNEILQAGGKLMRQRGVNDLTKFIEEFYTDHESFTRDQITPAFTALAEAIGAEAMREISMAWEWTPELEEWLEKYIRAFANRHSNRSRQQLLDLIAATIAEGDDVMEALTVRFAEWEEGRIEDAATRSEKIAAENSVRLGQGFSRETFFAAGVVSLMWIAVGSETCPYCRSLDGRIVGRETPFLNAGADFAPGNSEPLNPSTDIYHPPAHAGCDCFLIPGA